MQPFAFTADEIASVVAAVVTLTEIIKIKVPDDWGLFVAMIISALGLAAFAASDPDFTLSRFVIWPLFVGYGTTLAGAAGVFSIIKNVRTSDAMSSTPKMIALLLLPTLLLTSSACVRANANLSPERQVALYGTQVAGYLKEGKTVVDTLFQQQVIKEPEYRKALGILLKANEAGVQLMSALQAYDAATSAETKTSAAAQVDAALIALNTFLPQVLPEVTNADGRAKVASIVESVQKLILTITRATLPRLPATA